MRVSSFLSSFAVAAACAGFAAPAFGQTHGFDQGAYGWSGYRSGLVDAGPTPWQPTYPNYRYEYYSAPAGPIWNSSAGNPPGSMSQTVSTSYDDRAVWFSYGFQGTTLGGAGYTSLSTDVQVTGSTLNRVIQDPSDPNNVVGTASGVVARWYIEHVASDGGYNIWLANAANSFDLNSVRNTWSSYSVNLLESNFIQFPGYPASTVSTTFAQALAGAQSIGLLIGSNTDNPLGFNGMNVTQWIDVDPSDGWNPYATQRNSNYGAYAASGTATILFDNTVPAPSALALLSTLGLARGRRRR